MTFLAVFVLAGHAAAATAHAEDTRLSQSGLSNPCATTTDRNGDLYVALAGSGGPTAGRVNVYSPTGVLLTSITGFKIEPENCSVAVNGEGVVYVTQSFLFGSGATEVEEGRVAVYAPQGGVFPPTSGLAYAAPTLLPIEVTRQENIHNLFGGRVMALSVAVDPRSNAVFVSMQHGFTAFETELADSGLIEYQSAAAGSAFVRVLGPAPMKTFYYRAVAVSSSRGELVSSLDVPPPSGGGPREQVVVGIAISDGHKSFELDGSTTPPGSFSRLATARPLAIAVEQDTGNFYVGDLVEHGLVDEFGPAGASPSEPPAYISCIGKDPSCKPVSPGLLASLYGTGVAVDSPVTDGEPGYDSPNTGEIYLASGQIAAAKVLAFAPVSEITAPTVAETRATQISDTRATLQAAITPHGAPTEYSFEYVSDEQFVNSGFSGATIVPVQSAGIGSGISPVSVSQEVGSLQPGGKYHLRVRASNECEGGVECVTIGEEVTFGTYPTPEGLPEGRAYELVTPGRTGGRVPTQFPFGVNSHSLFPNTLVSADGDRLAYGVEGGGLPGIEGGNGFYETLEAVRGSEGWETRVTGPSASEAEQVYNGSVDIDRSILAMLIIRGTLAPGTEGEFFRTPSGSIEPVGTGGLSTDPKAAIKAVTSSGQVIFESAQEIEEGSPPTGTKAVYIRSPGGRPTLVSRLQDGEPANSAFYRGSSDNGSVVVFQIDFEHQGAIYERIDGATTEEVSPAGATFLGISKDGRWAVYQRGGEIFAFDGVTEETVASGSGIGAMVANVSADASHIYFISKSVLTAGEDNSFDEAAEAGKENLYVWDRQAGTIRFIATVLPRDVEGTERPGTGPIAGLGLWALDVVPINQSRGPADDPSRSTPDGNDFVFESQADLNGYDTGGHIEIYRYDAASASLLCVSCNPTGMPATADAQLQSQFAADVEPGSMLDPFAPVRRLSDIPNITTDGQRVFFQSGERLVANDTDEKIDVYEWVNHGVDGCVRAEGCIHLISSGQSAHTNYLYGMSPDGRDVFFETTDQLLGRDVEPTPSIYDARVEGGFPEPAEQTPCSGDACQGPSVGPPPGFDPSSAALAGPGNLKKSRPPCPKDKRSVKRHGKLVCTKTNQKKSKKSNKHSKHHGARKHGKTGGKGR